MYTKSGWRLHLPVLSLILVIAFGIAGHANAAERIAGPVVADIVEIVDGDSLKVSAHIWPGQRANVSVRLRGIDAPEMRARCKRERRLALAARDMLQSRVGGGPVMLINIGGGKYFGRVVADVRLSDGGDLAAWLSANAPVRPYHGGRRGKWCRPTEAPATRELADIGG